MLASALKTISLAGVGVTLTMSPPEGVEPRVLQVGAVVSPASGYFKLGSAIHPDGREISINSRHLLINGRPWFPVIGEFHFSRQPSNEWRESLEKMRAGGIRIVSTYVFWNHHEEVRGEWDWEGRKNLRAFLEICHEVGLLAIVRCGPWCNGEARYGGFPDWIENSPHWPRPERWGMRPEHPEFLAAVSRLYRKIGDQMQGLLWKDGGPVVAIQLDNEYSGPSSYLVWLKKLAIASGMDVPLYTKTGWPRMVDLMPEGEVIPFYGAYAEAAWEGSTEIYEDIAYNYKFRAQRIDESIASDVNTIQGGEDLESRERYPYLTAETGSGMFVSYHRRSRLDPRDSVALALCQIGSGAAGIGYYMYHGGENPDGKLSTLQKSTAIGDVFDIATKSYDFQAPIGQFGQIRAHYKWLRRLNLFLEDFGSDLAQMPAFLPAGKNNGADLRWSVRSDGDAGFLFVNNYQRLQAMPAVRDVRFEIRLPGGDKVLLPQSPVDIPANAFFHWPVNLDLNGARLIYATAQTLLKHTNLDGVLTVIFSETPGIRAEFAFDPLTLQKSSAAGPQVVMNAESWPAPPLRLTTANGKEVRIVLLNEQDSLSLIRKSKNAAPEFEKHVSEQVTPVNFEKIRPAGLLRQWRSSRPEFQLPVAPSETDYQHAAAWRIRLPAGLDMTSNPILRIRYTGDVARLLLNGHLLNDDFHNGTAFEIGLRRHMPQILTGELCLEILPLQKDMPVFFEPDTRPSFCSEGKALELHAVEIAETFAGCEQVAWGGDR
jgi:beta-galactosidase